MFLTTALACTWLRHNVYMCTAGTAVPTVSTIIIVYSVYRIVANKLGSVVYMQRLRTEMRWKIIYYTVRPRKKQNPETMDSCEQVLGCMTIIIYISWSMMNMLSNDTLLKFLQSCFTEQHCLPNWMSNPFVPRYGRQVKGFNRNPMCPSLG